MVGKRVLRGRYGEILIHVIDQKKKTKYSKKYAVLIDSTGKFKCFVDYENVLGAIEFYQRKTGEQLRVMK